MVAYDNFLKSNFFIELNETLGHGKNMELGLKKWLKWGLSDFVSPLTWGNQAFVFIWM